MSCDAELSRPEINLKSRKYKLDPNGEHDLAHVYEVLSIFDRDRYRFEGNQWYRKWLPAEGLRGAVSATVENQQCVTMLHPLLGIYINSEINAVAWNFQIVCCSKSLKIDFNRTLTVWGKWVKYGFHLLQILVNGAKTMWRTGCNGRPKSFP